MLKNKLVIFLISLVAAMVFWLFVVTTVAPGTTGSIGGISVAVTGDTTLEARGLMITELANETVRVEVETSRATLSKLNSGNMSAYVDVSRITEAGDYDLSYTVSFPDTVNSGEIQLLRKSVDKIHLTVCSVATKTFPLELQWSGQVPDGYLFNDNEVVFEPESVTLQGPDYEVNQVARVILMYDVSELTDTALLREAPIYLDSLGNELTLSTLTSVSAQEVTMTVPVSQYKDLRLAVDLTYGPGINSDNVSVTLDPDTVRVSGAPDVIAALGEQVTLGQIDLTQAQDGDSFDYVLRLPKGVNNVSGETTVTANVKFTGLVQRSIIVKEIIPTNASEDVDVSLSTRAVTVRLRGSREIVENIDENDIRIYVDLADYTQIGSYTVKGTVEIDGHPDVGLVGDVEIIVSIS